MSMSMRRSCTRGSHELPAAAKAIPQEGERWEIMWKHRKNEKYAALVEKVQSEVDGRRTCFRISVVFEDLNDARGNPQVLL